MTPNLSGLKLPTTCSTTSANVFIVVGATTLAGWGLRCKQDLHEGQFIDTYRGEVITDAEATRRETSSSKGKAFHLYSLNKFAESEGLKEEDLYVADAEFMGGPTKFINHSCDPNRGQYPVSYNKHDPRVYDTAFFARRLIPKGEELTFDYLDQEEGEGMDEPGEGALPCLCGASLVSLPAAFKIEVMGLRCCLHRRPGATTLGFP